MPGTAALARLARGWAGWVALAYHLAVAMVCASAIGLAVLDFAGLWWFVLVAAGSYPFREWFARTIGAQLRTRAAHAMAV